MAAEPDRFDRFADGYREILDANLAITGETAESFARRRVAHLRSRLPERPERVLDFGCGVGLAVPLLLEAFPGCHVVGVDVSPESVRLARERNRHERVRFSLPSELGTRDFDLVYASGVLHHVAEPERPGAVAFMWEALRPGGMAAIAEHNPWNPATRYLVRTCPFDDGVRLLRPKHAAALLERAGFDVVARDFLGFFPGPLRALRRLEPALRRIPAGAQYLLLARRAEERRVPGSG